MPRTKKETGFTDVFDKTLNETPAAKEKQRKEKEQEEVQPEPVSQPKKQLDMTREVRSARMQLALPISLREKLLAVKKKTGLPLNEIVNQILEKNIDDYL